jgi:hypothetical protein
MKNGWFIALSPLLLVGLNSSSAAIDCKDPEVVPGGRRTVKQNYMELVYDAQSGQLEWHRHFRDRMSGGPVTEQPIIVPQDTLFPPFAYQRERIIVKVCNAKFDSDVSASTSVTPIPESEPDIHGLQQSIAAPPTSQTPTGALTVAITPQTPSDLTTFINTAGARAAVEYLKALARMYDSDFRKIENDLNLLDCDVTSSSRDCNIDSIRYISERAQDVKADVETRARSADAFTNSGAFELLATRTSNIVSSLNNQGAALAALTLPDRILKLLADFQTLAGLVHQASTSNNISIAPSENDALHKLAEGIAATLDDDDPAKLVAETGKLDDEMTNLHRVASEIFVAMNKLHDNSNQVLATVLPPQSTNAVISVSIILHDAFMPFGFAPTSGSKPPSVTNNSPGNVAAPTSSNKGGGKKDGGSGDQTGNSSTQPPSSAPEQHVVRRVLIEVHRRADFNIVAGFTASTLRQTSFGLHEISATNTNLVVFRSQDDRFQLQPLVGLNMYLKKRDLFPGYLTPAMRWTPGILLGTSVSSLGNFMIGPDLEPVNGLDLYAGLHVGHTTDLATGVVPGVTQFDPKTSSAPTVQTLRIGLFFGIGFDLNVFKSIFQKSSSQ